MPPKGDRLSAAERQTLKEWIDSGAEWPDAVADLGEAVDSLAFQPVKRPAVPIPGMGQAGLPTRHPIDAFIGPCSPEQHLTPSPEADRRTLIRRLSFDCWGCRPARKRWLRSSRIPTRSPMRSWSTGIWPRHSSESVLLASGSIRSGSPRVMGSRPTSRVQCVAHIATMSSMLYRDLPYDQFVRQQLAGINSEPDGDRVHRRWSLGPREESRSVLTAQQRADELHDMVSTTGSVFLGLTVGCARCHSHKFAIPIQTDYYAMKAVFEGVVHGERDISLPMTPENQNRIDDLTRQIAALDAQLREFEPLATLAARAHQLHSPHRHTQDTGVSGPAPRPRSPRENSAEPRSIPVRVACGRTSAAGICTGRSLRHRCVPLEASA